MKYDVLAIVLFCLFSLLGCPANLDQLEYANIDAVAKDATGKNLWDIEFGESEVELINEKLWRTKMTNLYCIRDNAETQYQGSEPLTRKQLALRSSNIKYLTYQALVPTIKMREEHNHARVIRSGCNQKF